MNQILESLGTTPREFIERVLAKQFLLDLGLVVAVSADKTHVDVQHVVLQTINGAQQPATVTKSVELLYPGGGVGLSIQWPVAIGDPVLLLATRDYVDPFGGKTAPVPPVSGAHYTQDTMKALPLGALNSGSAFTIVVDGSGLLQVKNAAASLYTVLNNFLSAVNTFSNAAAQTAITTGGASSVSLAAAIDVLLAALNASIVSVTTALGQVMKA